MAGQGDGKGGRRRWRDSMCAAEARKE
jgi:hypothetical protein